MNNDRTQQINLLIGTNEGVYRSPLNAISSATRTLKSNDVMRLHRFGDAAFAATRSGLFRSADGGKTWKNLNVPQTEVYSVLQSPDGERLYAGTHPAHLYVSNDRGVSWSELEGLQDLPSRDSWRLPRHRNEAHVRSLDAELYAPERLIAGIEVGGVHISEDDGATWTERREGLHDDVHHVLVLSAEEYIASCGGGLYRTRDAGKAWTRLDNDLDHSYFREAIAAGGRLYAAAARSSPPWWGGEKGADAALFESTDGGDSFESVPYPGKSKEFILAWAALDGDEVSILAGTNEGRILRRATDGEWQSIGQLSATVRSLAAV